MHLVNLKNSAFCHHLDVLLLTQQTFWLPSFKINIISFHGINICIGNCRKQMKIITGHWGIYLFIYFHIKMYLNYEFQLTFKIYHVLYRLEVCNIE